MEKGPGLPSGQPLSFPNTWQLVLGKDTTVNIAYDSTKMVSS